MRIDSSVKIGAILGPIFGIFYGPLVKHSPQELTSLLSEGVDRSGGGLVRSLIEKLREGIISGALRAGDRLPASRPLAQALGVARGSVITAIDTLVAEGLLETRRGAGTFVANNSCGLRQRLHASEWLPGLPGKPLLADVDPVVASHIDFRPCRPSLASFPLAVWRRCLSMAGSKTPSADYGDARGQIGLRMAICDYLRRARGLVAEPDEIMVTNGAVNAMFLLASLYLDESAEVIVENPGFPLARQVFAQTGARVTPCPVDGDGLVTDALPKPSKRRRFVYVTPSHQFPTGARLTLSRRRQLIEWAESQRALIIEDDYDGEFRYDVAPLAPMAAMANRCVVYCGTFSKTLFPDLRVGFLVAPPELISRLANLRLLVEYAPNSIVQGALTHFINDAHYERHILRMRRHYREKRQLISATLSKINSSAILTGTDSGLNALIRLPKKTKGSTLSRRAARQAILLPSVTRYAFDNTVNDDAVVLGYAAATTPQLQQGLLQVFSSHSPA